MAGVTALSTRLERGSLPIDIEDARTTIRVCRSLNRDSEGLLGATLVTVCMGSECSVPGFGGIFSRIFTIGGGIRVPRRLRRDGTCGNTNPGSGGCIVGGRKGVTDGIEGRGVSGRGLGVLSNRPLLRRTGGLRHSKRLVGGSLAGLGHFSPHVLRVYRELNGEVTGGHSEEGIGARSGGVSVEEAVETGLGCNKIPFRLMGTGPEPRGGRRLFLGSVDKSYR